jgi:hypothetical protein
MGGLSVVILPFIIIPIILLSIASIILLIIGIIAKKDLLKRICGTILLTSPNFIYWIFLYSFLAETLQVSYKWVGILSILILNVVVYSLLILIWKKKLTEYIKYSKQAETPPYRSPMK